MVGKVKFYDEKRGFGFIVGSDDLDYFFHFTSIVGGEGFKVLHQDDRVSFDVKETDKGKSAINIEKQE